jgi:hypothetical protein
MSQQADSATTMPQDTSHERKIGLLDLPQELLDIIFDLAYPPGPAIKLIDPDDWRYRQKQRRRRERGYQTEPFPPFKAEEFMVSKKFFGTRINLYGIPFCDMTDF